MLSVPALCKGIFLREDSHLAAWDSSKNGVGKTSKRVLRFTSASARRTKVPRDFLLDLAKTAPHLVEGLQRHNQCNDAGENETIYLERLREEIWQDSALRTT